MKSRAILLTVLLTNIPPAALAATTYYISPTGNDTTGNGTLGNPYQTPTKAINLAAAGDTIFARGGTYSLGTAISMSKVGTAANPFNFFAYPGETPVLDFRTEPYSASNNGMKGINVTGQYWHVTGLTVQYAADNGINISGSNNTIEQVVARQNQDSGFLIGTSGGRIPSNNLLLNCDSYGNYDFGAGGENADGFAVKFRGLGTGNVISGARAYNNSDDGFDFWQAENGVTVVNSWAFHNGRASYFANPAGFAGDGNGIKLGHDSGTHLLENMLVWDNPANGVDINGNATQLEGDPPTITHGVTVYNVTAASNGKNFNFDENPTTATPSANHVLRNNLSFSGSNTINAGNTADHNTFAPGSVGVVTAADFLSTVDPVTTNGLFHPAGTGGDRSGTLNPTYATGPAVGPRQADGSLPILTYLHLVAGSDMIDAGVNVGLPYLGAAPDLGAFEFVPALATNGDYDDDGDVDASDIDILWHIVRGTGTDPNNNDTADLDGSGLVNEDDVDTMLAGKLTAGANRTYGDSDVDGDVDGSDFDTWRTRPGYTGPGTGAWTTGDFDGDGDVDGSDFELWRTRPAQFPDSVGAHSASEISAVPEPSTLLLALLALPIALLRRRGK